MDEVLEEENCMLCTSKNFKVMLLLGSKVDLHPGKVGRGQSGHWLLPVEELKLVQASPSDVKKKKSKTFTTGRKKV